MGNHDAAKALVDDRRGPRESQAEAPAAGGPEARIEHEPFAAKIEVMADARPPQVLKVLAVPRDRP